MNRRTFLQSALAGSALALARPALMLAAIPKMKIKRIRFYHNPLSKTLFNESFHIVTVETDQGLTGIGEGGSRDTVAYFCEDMVRSENLSVFQRADRESPHRLHAGHTAER